MRIITQKALSLTMSFDYNGGKQALQAYSL
jgi:hypothetical protein